MNIPWYICEGPFDSMFLDNCVAVCGSSISTELKEFHTGLDKVTIIFDNEPRNSDIVSSMQKIINQGLKIFIWPDYIRDKDLNDLFLTILHDEHRSNCSIEAVKTYIKNIISDNTYSNLSAELVFTQWKKV